MDDQDVRGAHVQVARERRLEAPHGSGHQVPQEGLAAPLEVELVVEPADRLLGGEPARELEAPANRVSTTGGGGSGAVMRRTSVGPVSFGVRVRFPFLRSFGNTQVPVRLTGAGAATTGPAPGASAWRPVCLLVQMGCSPWSTCSRG